MGSFHSGWLPHIVTVHILGPGQTRPAEQGERRPTSGELQQAAAAEACPGEIGRTSHESSFSSVGCGSIIADFTHVGRGLL